MVEIVLNKFSARVRYAHAHNVDILQRKQSDYEKSK
jgi:hypothetical protein